MDAPVVEHERLDERLASLREVEQLDPALLDELRSFITTATDEKLFRINPLRWAADRGFDDDATVEHFLYATHAGLLDFNWGVLCPSCGAFLSTDLGLRWLEGTRTCELCVLDVSVDVGDHVEVAFTVSPAVRSIRLHDLDEIDLSRDGLFVFFSTNVAHHPEVHTILSSAYESSVAVAGRGTVEVTVQPGEDHHLLMLPASHAVAHLPVASEHEATEATIDISPDGRLSPQAAPLSADGAVVTLRNQGPRTVTVAKLRNHNLAPSAPEDRSGPLYTLTPFLTGERVLTTQAFQDLFRASSVPATSGFQMRRVTIMFTDLTSSTDLYGRVGDLDAFSLVVQHFDVLRDIIRANGGAVVKTIGDAVMATFHDSESALRAAVDIQEQVGVVTGAAPLEIKVGLHAGPCVAVSLNDRLDYFGQTVNVAARVQAQARTGEIIATREVTSEGARPVPLEEHGFEPTVEALDLRGVEEPVSIVRWRRPG